MLIYNFQKEFLGIDEKDLHALGFKDLAGLRTEVTDFSDLFVKTPGYIHNFKHVHWIDFITCADSSEESKVIINVNNKNYRSIINISTAYLVDNPSSKAYLITLNNLRELTPQESESISGDITQRQAPQAPVAKPIFNTPEFTPDIEEKNLNFEEDTSTANVTIDPYEAPLEIDFGDTGNDSLLVDEYDEVKDNEIAHDSLDIEDSFVQEPEEDITTAPLNIEIEDDILSEVVTEKKSEVVTQTVHENYDNGYIYDPHVASDELGLPLDLIEEFIQDFIEQAKEFKNGLYTSLDENDLDNLKILSHKLKGVAANLRIEDALESLTIINTSSNTQEIREHLDTLYKIISKLAGEEIVTQKEVEIEIEAPTAPINEDQEIISIDFKDDFVEEEDDLYSDPISVETPPEDDLLTDDDKITIQESNTDLHLDVPLDILEVDSPFEDETPISVEDNLPLSIEDPLEIDELQVDFPDEDITVEYNKEQIAHEIGLDIASFDELFEDYLEEANELSQTIHESIDSDNYQNCNQAAVTLRGMSDNMRIDFYTQELQTLMNSSDKEELSKAIKKVDIVITKLSTIGV